MQLIIRTDGGARGNPGPAAIGIVIQDETGRPLFEAGYFIVDQWPVIGNADIAALEDG